MKQRFATILLSLLSGLWLASANRSMAGDRSPAEILKELDQVKQPAFDRAKLEDDAYGREFTSRPEEAIEKRATLISKKLLDPSKRRRPHYAKVDSSTVSRG
jgi:hypothetical protein